MTEEMAEVSEGCARHSPTRVPQYPSPSVMPALANHPARMLGCGVTCRVSGDNPDYEDDDGGDDRNDIRLDCERKCACKLHRGAHATLDARFPHSCVLAPRGRETLEPSSCAEVPVEAASHVRL